MVHVLGPALDKMDIAREVVSVSGAEAMVISVPEDDLFQRELLGCDGGFSYEVICVSPEPMTTQGESIALAALVRERGWTRVAVLTHTSHITRTRMQMERCVPAEVVVWERPYQHSVAGWVDRFVYESGAMVKAEIRRGC